MNGRSIAAAVTADTSPALKSLRYRRRMLEIIKHAGAGPYGRRAFRIDILERALQPHLERVAHATFADPRRDRYIQSKGHCVEALYVRACGPRFLSRCVARDTSLASTVRTSWVTPRARSRR